MSDRLYTTNQLAKLFGVVPTTVIDWIEAGKLRAFKTLGGHRRITHSSVLQFLDECNLDSPPAFSSEEHKILVLDDEPGVLKLFGSLLEAGIPNAKIITVDHAVDALVIIGAERPEIVVFDIFMPDVDGFEFCKRLREAQGKAVKMIAISGESSSETVTRIKAAGADKFLAKTEANEKLAKLCLSFL